MSSVQTTNCLFEFISIHYFRLAIALQRSVYIHNIFVRPCTQTQGRGSSPHLQSSLGPPRKAQPVGQHSGCDSGPVVAAPAHKHDTQAGHTPLRAERHLCGTGAHLRCKQRRYCSQMTHLQVCASQEFYHYVVPISVRGSGLVGIAGRDVRIWVLHIGAVDENVNRHDLKHTQKSRGCSTGSRRSTMIHELPRHDRPTSIYDFKASLTTQIGLLVRVAVSTTSSSSVWGKLRIGF